MALRYLKEYVRIMGPNMRPEDKVNEYIATAQKAYDLEEKAQKRKKEKEERERQKKLEQEKKGAGGGEGGGGGDPQ
jgi:hypothetical protein